MDNVKSKFKVIPWPANLVADVTGRTDLSYEDAAAIAQKMMQSLDSKEYKVIIARYAKQLPIEKVGTDVHMRRSTVSKTVSSLIDRLAATNWMDDEDKASQNEKTTESNDVVRQEKGQPAMEDTTMQHESFGDVRQNDSFKVPVQKTNRSKDEKSIIDADAEAKHSVIHDGKNEESHKDLWGQFLNQLTYGDISLDPQIADVLCNQASGSFEQDRLSIKTKTPIAYVLMTSSCDNLLRLTKIASNVVPQAAKIEIIPDYPRQEPIGIHYSADGSSSDTISRASDIAVEIIEIKSKASSAARAKLESYGDFAGALLYAACTAAVRAGKKMLQYLKETAPEI